MPLRFEDTAQDGRLLLEALAPALGESVWRGLLLKLPAAVAMQELGIIPILTYLVVDGTPGPFSAQNPLTVEGSYQFAKSLTPQGEVDRLLADMWVQVQGPLDVAYGEKPEKAGEVRLAGRLFAQYVFTRLFAEPSERKVTRLTGMSGLPEVPEAVGRWISPGQVLALPEGARWLEPAPRADPAAVVFGITHTDSNQHVNSLVYPRLFEEAALRRLGELGQRTDVLSRFGEVAFRKPSFAGERARLVLQTFELAGRTGAVGMFVEEAALEGPLDFATAKPRCTLRMLFEP